MDFKIVDAIFNYTQSLKSSEDVVTAIFATALDYCPIYAEEILKKMRIDLSFEKDFCLSTGYVINDFAWCKEINFKPDLVISNIEEGWDNDVMPKGENLILIESKLWANLPERQENCYKSFRDIFNKTNNVKNILITIKKLDTDAFDNQFTWKEIINYSEEIHLSLDDCIEEKSILWELIELMKYRLIPPIMDFKDKNDKLCPKEILSRIKNRLESKEFKKIKNVKTISLLYDEEYLPEIEKSLSLSSDCKISYFEFNMKNDKYAICCGIVKDKNIATLWIEDEDSDDLGVIDKPYHINFDSENWTIEWFDAIVNIDLNIGSIMNDY